MAHNLPLLLTIRTLPQQGEKIKGSRWLPFIDFLRDELRVYGSESNFSSDELLIYSFSKGLEAFPILLSALSKSKQEHDWHSSSGPCPIQIVMGLITSGENEISTMIPADDILDTLHHEVIYITSELEQIWQTAVNELNNFPEHTIQSDDSALNRVVFLNHDVGKKPKLLAFRALPVSGPGKECFYCGMTSHQPSQCPSKHLSMSSWALGNVGYLTFAQLNTLYKEVFPEKPALVAELAAGVNTAQIRKHAKLLTFISFFDISVVFQPRFLWNFVFSGYSQWDSIFLSDRLKIDNHNLHLGMDCLRVGQLEQAMEILDKENKRKDGNRFAANIALAFCAMEMNRESDMVRYLNESRNLAHHTREVIYVNLLLSRHFELSKNSWNAKEAVANALKADYDCLDVLYRRIQLAVQEGGLSDRELKQLRSLIVGQKEIFIKALIDPQMIPIQGLIEEILSHQQSVISVDAHKNFKTARIEAKALEVWLPKEDRRLEENKTSLEQLEKKLARKSYFDLLDVSERCNGLLVTCRRLRKDYSERLDKEIVQLGIRLDSYITYWKGYEYKTFSKEFQTSLTATTRKTQHAQLLLKENKNESTRQAIALSKETHAEFAHIKKEYNRLLWIRTTLNGLKIFAKRLLISEVSIIVLLAISFPMVSTFLADSPSFSNLAELAGNKEVQKNIAIIASIFLAPFISLAWTMMELQNKPD